MFTNTVTGVASNAGDITLATAGALTLDQAVTTGSSASNTVRLQAAGDITQAAAGTITALNLGVFDSAGNITLDQANVIGNASPGTFAAQDTAAGATIVFNDNVSNPLQTGVIGPSSVFTHTVTGVASNAGDITLVTQGDLTLQQSVTTGSGASSTVRLYAYGNLIESAGVTITGSSLGVVGAGNVTLDQANVVGTNATAGTIAFENDRTGPIVFNDATTGTLQIDSVSSSSAFPVSLAGVVCSAGDITLSTGGALTLNQQVSTGSSASGTVRLQANGTVDQSATGVITALNLGVNTPLGDIDLCLADNAVSGNFGATATTGGIAFRDSLAYTPGAVTAQGAFLGANAFTTVAGGNITLISDGALNFTTAGLPGAIGTLRLSAGGDVTQSAGAAGAITASTLVVVTSSGKIDLENAANSFSTLASARYGYRRDHRARLDHDPADDRSSGRRCRRLRRRGDGGGVEHGRHHAGD